jgi:TonB family protein
LPDHYSVSPRGLRFTQKIWLSLLAILHLLFCMMGFVPTLTAQKTPRTERKVLVSEKPLYPEPLKHAQIGGLVRLQATVLPNGKVSNVGVLGGNPVLAESAVAAIKRWKFAPAPSQTVQEIDVNFDPRVE